MRALCGVVLGVVLTGCDGPGDGAGEIESNLDASAWGYVGELTFAEANGELLTLPVELEDAAEGFALFAEVDGCAQVALLEDDESTWVGALESGASCSACEERFSVIAGSGMLVHRPLNPSPGSVRLRLGKIDCTTLTRSRPGSDEATSSVRLWIRELPTVPREAVVPLRFHHGGDSSWAGDAESEALLEATVALLAPTGVRIVLDGSSHDAPLPESLPWYEGDPSALRPFVDPEDGVVDVVFAGCVERVHPELRTHTTLDGLVPRVPAQAADGGGIFLRGRACSKASLGPTSTSLHSQSRILAHELGHYLGLYHSEEADGRTDRLDDTDDATLMAPTPGLVIEPVFSPAQAERMRLHAALLAEPMPDR